MKVLSLLAVLCCATHSYADIIIPMNMVDEKGVGVSIGQINAADSAYGLVLTPNLTGLPAGLHGFHIHENPSCDAKEKDGKMTPALAAGGHLDPKGTKKHDTPWGEGHLGDLPALFVDANGKATQPVLAPRLKLADVVGRSIMIHAGGDNHADHPMPLGGGAARMACGVIKKLGGG
ncbi:superoxide dismutase family protein [Agitococcus lubricus]|uniref:Cu-Zn family superoxide dismutase n=1 Tax=Agitococcus lubricus TaxID=1077255 RepID=A0A2T5IWS4_9GAMM|nr:superoxide dismutase family protein [Agitococcus lubricus]PTQ88382.1 Cu-Zn family superoxide dismutase [Agitococcus lubricus]